jgi:hypothetical protein
VWCKVGGILVWICLFYETYLVFIDLAFFAWGSSDAFCFSALFMWRRAPRAAEQRPDEERGGSDPRLGFAAFFTPRAQQPMRPFLAPKNCVCQPGNRPGRKRGPGEKNTVLETGLEKKRGPGQQGNPKNRRLHPRLYYSRL